MSAPEAASQRIDADGTGSPEAGGSTVATPAESTPAAGATAGVGDHVPTCTGSDGVLVAEDGKITGTDGDDEITCTDLHGLTEVDGLGGNDTIRLWPQTREEAGPELTVRGGEGNDTIESGDLVTPSTTFLGGEGEDRITVDGVFGAADGKESLISGGGGKDTVKVKAIGSRAVVRGDADDDSISIGEEAGDNDADLGSSVYGGDGNDTIEIDGSLIETQIRGGDGNDKITVRNGISEKALVSGGGGNDTLDVYEISDGAAVLGEDGDDDITFSGVVRGGVVDGGEGNDILRGGEHPGVEKLERGVADGGVVRGGGGDDTIQGILESHLRASDANSSVDGGDGTDTCYVKPGFHQIHSGEKPKAPVTSCEQGDF
ncbi:hypothetical protein [Streptomyces sp. NPDC057682]|uniref:hypothetical protein n=1 Tax=Streptomyces sp. NPDC057682 TaxID=3346210 RepID=UPI0036C0A2CE